MEFIVENLDDDKANGCIINEVCAAKNCTIHDACVGNAEPCAGNGSIN